MRQIREEAEIKSLIETGRPIVAVFKTTWCKDCHFIDPFMPDIEKKYEGQLELVHLDRDDMADFCSELNILGIPSFVAWSGGREITRFVSKDRKTREEIEQYLDRTLEVAQALT